MRWWILCCWLTGVTVVAGDAGQATALHGPVVPPAPAATVVKHVDPTSAERLISEKKVVVLDIRTPTEFAAGHIAGATNLDFRAKQFDQSVAALDRSKTYLVLCASGRRSTSALPTFTQLGFKEVIHLDGGMSAWQSAAKPVAR